LRLKD